MHQKPDPLRWRSCLLAICLGGLTSITWGAEDPVFSGPQAGEKLTTFKVRGLFDDLAGKELDLIQKADGKPVLFIFVHQLTRPSNSLTQVLMRYVEQHPQELYGSLIFLGDDQTALESRLKRARHALPKKAPVTISLDGKEGPGAYGLNRNVTLTILFAKDRKVVSNFALSTLESCINLGFPFGINLVNPGKNLVLVNRVKNGFPFRAPPKRKL